MNKLHFSRVEDINKVVLANGATLLSQRVPDALSVSLGIWVRSGSRDEDPVEHGITHFLEHMVFKGTGSRTALELALAMDRLGGQLDAFTTKELTCFTARVLAEYFDTALDVISDLITDPMLDDRMIATERRVVHEEIRNVLDEPDDQIHDLASALLFGDHPLGRSILGTVESVDTFDSTKLRSYLEQKYNAGNVVVAVVGPLEHDEVRRRVEKRFTIREGMSEQRSVLELPRVEKQVQVGIRDLNQQHLWIGRRGLSSCDADRYVMLLLSTILGGSMSSRLFQAIREDAGLAYSIFSFSDFSSDSGILATYMAVSPDRAEEAITRTLDEFVRLISNGCGETELEDTKMQLKGNLLLAMESVSARMSRLARMELNEGRFIGVQELVDRVDKVSVDDINRIASKYLDPDTLTLVSLGPSPATGPF